MNILVITNDSTVFRFNEAPAEKMFGGRVTEFRNFLNLMRGTHDVTFGLISGKYGFIMGDAEIERYDHEPDHKNEYRELQQRTDYAGSIKELSKQFDCTMVFIPKEMMRILIDENAFKGNVISATSLEFKDHFERRGWHFFERRGARIGKRNAETIFKLISSSSFP